MDSLSMNRERYNARKKAILSALINSSQKSSRDVNESILSPAKLPTFFLSKRGRAIVSASLASTTSSSCNVEQRTTPKNLKSISPEPVVVVECPIRSQQTEKIQHITQCLERRNVDLWELRELALTRGGLINGEMRRKAWHKLVGLDRSAIQDFGRDSHDSVIEPCEMDLIRRDAVRSVLFRYRLDNNDADKTPATTTTSSAAADSTPTTSPDSSFESSCSGCGTAASGEWEGTKVTTTSDIENMLPSVIASAVWHKECRRSNSGEDDTVEEQEPSLPEEEDSRLHYYQGFHDIASVFLLNLHRPTLTSAVLHQISHSHLRDFMQPSFIQVTTLLDIVLLPLILAIDEEMHDFLMHSEVEMTVFMPWLISWFAHDIYDEEVTSRLFDAFIVSHPLMPLFFAVALILHPFHRQKILSTECDPVMVHMVIKDLLSDVKSDWTEGNETSFLGDSSGYDALTCQDLIDDAIAFMSKVPPNSLLALSKRYHYGDDTIQDRAANIAMLSKPPPTWALTSFTPSDSVRRRQKRTRHISPKKQSPKLSESSEPSTKACTTAGRGRVLFPKEATTETPYARAKVASGMQVVTDKDAEGAGDRLSTVGMLGRFLSGLWSSTGTKRIEVS